MANIRFHILITADTDSVLFCQQGDGSVLVRNAERTMGSKWKDGVYSEDDARTLWSMIIDYGGRLLDPEITKTISDIHESAVKELVQKTNTKIEAMDKRITDMEAEVKWRIAQISRSEKQIMAQSDQIQDARALIEDLGGSNVVLMFDTMREVTNDRYM
jgi:hypothetical protein